MRRPPRRRRAAVPVARARRAPAGAASRDGSPLARLARGGGARGAPGLPHAGRARRPPGQPRGARARHRRAGPTARAPAGRAVGRARRCRASSGSACASSSPRGRRSSRATGWCWPRCGRMRARASASGSGPRCSCWARRAPHGSASGRGHGAADRIRTARRAVPPGHGSRRAGASPRLLLQRPVKSVSDRAMSASVRCCQPC